MIMSEGWNVDRPVIQDLRLSAMTSDLEVLMPVRVGGHSLMKLAEMHALNLGRKSDKAQIWQSPTQTENELDFLPRK